MYWSTVRNPIGCQARLSRFLDRRSYQVTPLGPGPVIIPHARVAEQVGQRKPGMSRTLSNTTVGDDISIRRDILATVDLAQLISRFERAIGIRCRCPGNALGGRYVPTTLATLLSVGDHLDQLTGILLRRAYFDHTATGVL